jgi:hypothetical protein
MASSSPTIRLGYCQVIKDGTLVFRSVIKLDGLVTAQLPKLHGLIYGPAAHMG